MTRANQCQDIKELIRDEVRLKPNIQELIRSLYIMTCHMLRHPDSRVAERRISRRHSRHNHPACRSSRILQFLSLRRHAGECFMASPSELANYSLVCRSGPALVVVFLYHRVQYCTVYRGQHEATNDRPNRVCYVRTMPNLISPS